VAINPVDGSQKWIHFPAVGNYYGREPAVSPDGKHVYYGGDAGAGGGYRGRIYCLNTSDGSQDWFYQLDSVYSQQYELIDGGPKIGPDGTIYVQSLSWYSGTAKVWAINADGSFKWYRKVIAYSYSDMLYHSPCIGSDGCIYLTDSAGQLWKFDSAGNVLWPAVYVNYTTKYPGSLDEDNNFYVACDEGRDVNKFAPDGMELWHTLQWDFYLHCSPAHDAQGYIYATGGWDSTTTPQGYRLRKMNPTTGATVWEKSLAAITTALMAVSKDGHIYVSCGNGSSAGPGLQCWDTNGNQIFSLPLPYQAGSPAIGADGTVYVEANHILYAIGD
jgi:outer membrane protein assembly factor BamB